MRDRAALAAAAAGLFVACLPWQPMPAAASGYTYWHYWHKASDNAPWQFSGCGPDVCSASSIPDGALEGWRYEQSSSASSGNHEPAPTPSFSSVCQMGTPERGYKRVAEVIQRDNGTTYARCAVDVTSANGGRLLEDVSNINVQDNGVICAIDDYPSASCGAHYPRSPHSPAPQPTPSSAKSGEPEPAAPAPGPAPDAGVPAGQAPSGESAGPNGAPASASDAVPDGATAAAGPSTGQQSTSAQLGRSVATARESSPVLPSDPPGGATPRLAAGRGVPLGSVLAVGAIAALAGGGALVARRRTRRA